MNLERITAAAWGQLSPGQREAIKSGMQKIKMLETLEDSTRYLGDLLDCKVDHLRSIQNTYRMCMKRS